MCVRRVGAGGRTWKTNKSKKNADVERRRALHAEAAAAKQPSTSASAPPSVPVNATVLRHRCDGANLEEVVLSLEELYDLRPVDAPFHPPSTDFSSQVAAAAQFRRELWKGVPSPNCICAVCVRPSDPGTTHHIALTKLAGLDLLCADAPSSPELPRRALTTRTLNGVKYCLAPASLCNSSGGQRLHNPPADAHPDDWGYVCCDCLTDLKAGQVPRASLVRIDAGARPAHLEPLSMMEASLLSLGRVPARHIMTVSKAKGRPYRGHEEEKCNRGHVLALPNNTSERMVHMFPCSPAELPDRLQVVMLHKAATPEEVRRVVLPNPFYKEVPYSNTVHVVHGAHLGAWCSPADPTVTHASEHTINLVFVTCDCRPELC